MFIVKRKRGSSAKSSRSGSQQQPHESDGSSHNSNPSLNSVSVQLKSILKQESSVDDDTTPSKASSGNQPSTGGSQYSCRRVGFKHVHVREFERYVVPMSVAKRGAKARMIVSSFLFLTQHHFKNVTESLETIQAAAVGRQ